MSRSSILIVEDQRVVAEDIKQSLSQMGYDVSGIVSSGEEVAAAVESRKTDLVLMDIMLKGRMNGIDAAGQLNNHFDIPVVYLTAYADEDILKRAKTTEPYGYIVKPFDERELKVSIEIALYKHRMERKLKENREWFATTLNSIGDAVIATDPEGRVRFMNPVAEDLTGWNRDESLGRPLEEVFQIVNEHTRERVENPVAKVIATGNVIGLANHTVLIGRDGREFPIRDSGAPIRLENGGLLGVVLVFRDVTAEQRAELALRKSEAKYRDLVESANSIILRFGPRGRITFFNDFAQKFFGFSEEEIIGRNILGNIVPETDSSGRDLKAMVAEMLQNPENFNFNENENIKRNGERVWIAWRNRAILNEDGELVEILSVGIDISDRKRAEEDRIRLETAINSAAESVMITDDRGLLQYVNPAFENITGYAQDEALGQNPRILKSGRHDPSFYEKLWETISGGAVWKGHFINKNKQGHIFEEDATISPVKNDAGKIINYVGVKRDVTAEISRERQFRQAQKMEALGALAGGIAHDFNNILSSIIGFSEIALSKLASSTEVHSYLQEVLNAGMRARELVRQILTFSRQADQELQPVQVKLIAKEVLKMLRASLPATIEIRQDIRSDRTVLADPTQIHQILMNLCTNASHAMQEKGGILTVSLTDEELGEEFAERHRDVAPGSFIRLKVSDTGHGMPSDILENIFDPFFTTKKREEGTGLGLSVVHGIVKGHGGFVTVSSKIGRGSTFEVYLPVIHSGRSPALESSAPQRGGNEHILLVDDEKPLVDLERSFLEQKGYRVSTRTSSVEALELFKAKPKAFDLVITDMTMPNMTGKDLAREIMRIRPEIPIIICTGFSREMTPESAQKAGIRAFIRKPIIGAELIGTVRNVLNGVSD